MQQLLHNYSDHLLLLVNTQGFNKLPCIPKSSGFQVAWTTHEGFEHALQENWCNKKAIVSALQSLSSALNTWNKEVFDNFFRRKRKLLGTPSGHTKETKRGTPLLIGG